MKRLMSREMLRELIDLVEPHKEEHLELYKYLTITWTACHYNSTLYACNVDGMTVMQRHLSEFEPDIMRFYESEMDKSQDVN
jgi:hypothetical protein